jgi:hypothetical protein
MALLTLLFVLGNAPFILCMFFIANKYQIPLWFEISSHFLFSSIAIILFFIRGMESNMYNRLWRFIKYKLCCCFNRKDENSESSIINDKTMGLVSKFFYNFLSKM